MAEEMRLEASVVDKFSKPLRDLRNRLNDVKTPEHVKGMSSDFKRLESSVLGASKSIREGLGQAMAGLSIPSLAAVASISGIVAAVKNFSAGTIELRQFQRETGLTAGALKALQHSASQFGISDDAIAPGLKNFSNNLHDFKRQYGETYGFLLEHARGFAEKLRTDSPAKALEDSLKYLEQLAQQRDPRTAGLIAEKLFGSDVFARFGLRGRQSINDLIKEMRKAKGPSADDEDAATAFDRNVEKLRESFKNLGKTVGSDLTPALGQAVGFIDKFIDANKERFGTNLQEAATNIGKALSSTNWRDVSTSIGVIRQSFEAMAGPIKAISDFMDKIPGLNWTPQDEADLSVRGGRFIERFLSGKKFGASEELADARKALAQYDKDHHYSGAAGMRGAANDMVRTGIVHEIERLEKATEAGTEKGMTNFFQKQSFSGSGVGDGMRPILASYGGGNAGGISEHPAIRALRRRAGQGAGSPVDPKGFSGATGKWWNAEHVSHAVERLRREAGLSEAGAEGLVARWAGVEAAGGPRSRNPYSGAMGVGQWLGVRKRGFTADFDSQLSHAITELNNFENGGSATRALRAARNAAEAAVGASRYERAEGYNPRTGRDNFTNKSFAAAARIHGLAGHVPPPGSLLGRNSHAAPRGPDGNATLHVKIDHNGMIKTRADGGGLFSEMRVNRGRSMVAAQEI